MVFVSARHDGLTCERHKLILITVFRQRGSNTFWRPRNRGLESAMVDFKVLRPLLVRLGVICRVISVCLLCPENVQSQTVDTVLTL